MGQERNFEDEIRWGDVIEILRATWKAILMGLLLVPMLLLGYIRFFGALPF